MYTHKEIGSDVLIRHFISKANSPIKPEQIYIDSVKSATSKYGDTVTILKAAPDMGLSGEFSFFYSRVDIAQVIAGLVLTVPYRNYKNSFEVLYEINNRYGFQIEEQEILAEDYGTQGAFALTMSDASYLWKGKILVVREAAADSIVRLIDGPPTPSSPLVPEVTKDKITGDLLYEIYNFTPLLADITALGTGLSLELQVLEFLGKAVKDPWMLDKIGTANFNVAGCKVVKVKDGVWNVLEIQLGKQCANVNGTLRFKYMTI